MLADTEREQRLEALDFSNLNGRHTRTLRIIWNVRIDPDNVLYRRSCYIMDDLVKTALAYLLRFNKAALTDFYSKKNLDKKVDQILKAYDPWDTYGYEYDPLLTTLSPPHSAKRSDDRTPNNRTLKGLMTELKKKYANDAPFLRDSSQVVVWNDAPFLRDNSCINLSYPDPVEGEPPPGWPMGCWPKDKTGARAWLRWEMKRRKLTKAKTKFSPPSLDELRTHLAERQPENFGLGKENYNAKDVTALKVNSEHDWTNNCGQKQGNVFWRVFNHWYLRRGTICQKYHQYTPVLSIGCIYAPLPTALEAVAPGITGTPLGITGAGAGARDGGAGAGSEARGTDQTKNSRKKPRPSGPRSDQLDETLTGAGVRCSVSVSLALTAVQQYGTSKSTLPYEQHQLGSPVCALCKKNSVQPFLHSGNTEATCSECAEFISLLIWDDANGGEDGDVSKWDEANGGEDGDARKTQAAPDFIKPPEESAICSTWMAVQLAQALRVTLVSCLATNSRPLGDEEEAQQTQIQVQRTKRDMTRQEKMKTEADKKELRAETDKREMSVSAELEELARNTELIDLGSDSDGEIASKGCAADADAVMHSPISEDADDDDRNGMQQMEVLSPTIRELSAPSCDYCRCYTQRHLVRTQNQILSQRAGRKSQSMRQALLEAQQSAHRPWPWVFQHRQPINTSAV
jgi:hypothetical protein